MRYSIRVKFLIFFLTACALVAAIGSGAGIVALESSGMYVGGLDILQDRETEAISDTIASEYVHYHAVKQLSNLNYTMRESMYPNPRDRGDADHWAVKLMQGDTVLQSPEDPGIYSWEATYTLTPLYPIVSFLSPEEVAAADTFIGQHQQNTSFTGVLPPQGYLYHDSEVAFSIDGFVTYHYYYYEAPEYTITVYMNPEVLESSALHILTAMYPYRYTFIFIVAFSLLLFAAGLVYLCWAAGRASDRKIRPGGLNRVALDVYALLTLFGELGLFAVYRVLQRWIRYEGPHPGNLSLIAVNLLAMTLLGIGLIAAFSAQIKLKGFLWRNSAIGRFSRRLRRLLGWVPGLIKLVPLTWRVLFGFVLYLGVLVASAVLASRGTVLPLIVTSLAGIGVIGYFCYAYGCILSGARRMARSDFLTKIPTKYLYGTHADFARQLNALAQVAVDSARKQMRSDRMKAELITNISHDIKTPLTSIVNYTDLMSKPHTPEQQAQYLEVLGRQSLRLKKLLEDLVEMSRASSGNLPLELTCTDAVETVNQALGEFSDKLDAAGLTAVFQAPAQPVYMHADGRLVWRVLSNLLSNIVKYAQSGTRVYVEIGKTDTHVQIRLKNISREPLNRSVEELTERFVRGDVSRNTEGSGLGLHIARSLMELQKGSLLLAIDGDLFKAELSLRQAEPEQP